MEVEQCMDHYIFIIFGVSIFLRSDITVVGLYYIGPCFLAHLLPAAAPLLYLPAAWDDVTTSLYIFVVFTLDVSFLMYSMSCMSTMS